MSSSWHVSTLLHGYYIEFVFEGGRHVDTRITETAKACGETAPSEDEFAKLRERAYLAEAIRFATPLPDEPRFEPVAALAKSVRRICDEIDSPTARGQIQIEAREIARIVLDLATTASESSSSFKASGYAWALPPALAGRKASEHDLGFGERRLSAASEEIGISVADVLSRKDSALDTFRYEDMGASDILYARTVIFADGTIVSVMHKYSVFGGDIVCLLLPDGQCSRHVDGKLRIEEEGLWVDGEYHAGKFLRYGTEHEEAALRAIRILFPREEDKA